MSLPLCDVCPSRLAPKKGGLSDSRRDGVTDESRARRPLLAAPSVKLHACDVLFHRLLAASDVVLRDARVVFRVLRLLPGVDLAGRSVRIECGAGRAGGIPRGRGEIRTVLIWLVRGGRGSKQTIAQEHIQKRGEDGGRIAVSAAGSRQRAPTRRNQCRCNENSNDATHDFFHSRAPLRSSCRLRSARISAVPHAQRPTSTETRERSAYSRLSAS